MGEFLAEKSNIKQKNQKRISITEAKKKIVEAKKTLFDVEQRIGFLRSVDFYESYQLQEWFSIEISKVKKLLEW